MRGVTGQVIEWRVAGGCFLAGGNAGVVDHLRPVLSSLSAYGKAAASGLDDADIASVIELYRGAVTTVLR